LLVQRRECYKSCGKRRKGTERITNNRRVGESGPDEKGKRLHKSRRGRNGSKETFSQERERTARKKEENIAYQGGGKYRLGKYPKNRLTGQCRREEDLCGLKDNYEGKENGFGGKGSS